MTPPMPVTSVSVGCAPLPAILELQNDCLLDPLRVEQPRSSRQCRSIDPNDHQHREMTPEVRIANDLAHCLGVGAAGSHLEAGMTVPFADVIVACVPVLRAIEEAHRIARGLKQ